MLILQKIKENKCCGFNEISCIVSSGNQPQKVPWFVKTCASSVSGKRADLELDCNVWTRQPFQFVRAIFLEMWGASAATYLPRDWRLNFQRSYHVLHANLSQLHGTEHARNKVIGFQFYQLLKMSAKNVQSCTKHLVYKLIIPGAGACMYFRPDSVCIMSSVAEKPLALFISAWNILTSSILVKLLDWLQVQKDITFSALWLHRCHTYELLFDSYKRNWRNWCCLTFLGRP